MWTSIRGLPRASSITITETPRYVGTYLLPFHLCFRLIFFVASLIAFDFRADLMARSQYSCLPRFVDSRSSIRTSAKKLSSSSSPSLPSSCYLSISNWISSFLFVINVPVVLSCTITLWYSHCPCVILSNLLIITVIHLSIIILDPDTCKCCCCSVAISTDTIPIGISYLDLFKPETDSSYAKSMWLNSVAVVTT